MVEIANEFFGPKPFTRRQLIDTTEQILRQQHLWTRRDDKLSGGIGTKPSGRIEIENRFADLQRWRVLLPRQANRWRLATPKFPVRLKTARATPKAKPSLARFQHREIFQDFLKENGAAMSGRTYVSWINSAARRLGLSLGPAHLSSEADVMRLLKELHAIDLKNNPTLFIDKPRMETNLRSAFRKYAQMVQSNFRGLFQSAPAKPAPVARAARLDKLPPLIQQNSKKYINHHNQLCHPLNTGHGQSPVAPVAIRANRA
ncbi:MAG: hypothetical protein JWR26_300 [Pedosphaera sp.]|nr:hypothetical protein [Pedosphaera sp.]